LIRVGTALSAKNTKKKHLVVIYGAKCFHNCSFMRAQVKILQELPDFIFPLASNAGICFLA